MALIKQKTRKKLSKQLAKLVKKHGPEMTVALVTGIVSGLAAEKTKKTARAAGARKRPKPEKAQKPATVAARPAGRAAAAHKRPDM
jgi:hypothetical protein